MKALSIIKVGVISSFLMSIISPQHLTVQDHEPQWYRNWLTCSTCYGFADILKAKVNEVQNVKALKGALWFGCAFQYSQEYCKSLVESQVDVFIEEVFQLMLSPQFACGYIFDMCDNVYYVQNSTADFQQQILKDKPQEANQYLNNLYQSSNLLTNPPTFNLLFFSDFQIDPNYEAGTSSVYCNEPSCCHNSTPSVSEIDAAPIYGSKNCYMPLEGYKRMMDKINSFNKTNIPFSSVIYAGGSLARDPVNMTNDLAISVHKELISYMASIMPFKGLYYALGETDLSPPDLQFFDVEDDDSKLSGMDVAINDQTVNTDLVSSIKNQAEARANFTKYGFYTANDFIYQQEMNSLFEATASYPETSLVLVFLNTNACNNRNWGLLQEAGDPADQLKFLYEQLLKVETDGKKAWIIGYMNPGSSKCNSKWARRYHAIIERFQAVVRFQLFGHEASDYFQLQFPAGSENDPNKKPFGVTFQGPRATTLNQKPRFKVFEIDWYNYIPQRMITYEYNIETDQIVKVKEFPDSVEGMSSLAPIDWQVYASIIYNSEEAALDFINFMMCPDISDQKQACYSNDCDQKCRADLVCQLMNANQQDILACRGDGIMHDSKYGWDYFLSSITNPFVTLVDETPAP